MTSDAQIVLSLILTFAAGFIVGFLAGCKWERSAALQAFANRLNSGEIMTRRVHESLMKLNQSSVIEELAHPSPPPRVEECGRNLNGPIFCNLPAGHEGGHNRRRPAGTVIS